MATSNTNSAEAEIDALLQKCRTAASQESLTAALEDLASVIPPTTNEGRCDEIALFLIRNVVIVGKAVAFSLDKCLDACGPESTLGACSQTILEAASIKIESPCPLETSFRTIRRLLLTIPETQDELSWLKNVYNNVPPTRSTARNDKIMIQACMDNIVSTALLIPSQIANACHFQRLVLPAWSVRSRYIPRLVECALAMNKQLQSSRPNAADVYLHTLVQKIVHNGSSDEVAIALYQYYDKCNDTDWFEKTILETMRSLSTPRDVATLLRSTLRHLLSKQAQPFPENQTVDEYCRENLLPYLNVLCRPILQSSRNVQQAFVQLSILSSSSSSSSSAGNIKSDRLFCHCVALLLASCGLNEEEDDDSGSDDSSDDDSSCLGKPTSVLGSHVNQAASCWSETVFVQRTNGALQHHVTNFILSVIPMLDRENKNPLSSLMGVLLNGVSARLQSSNHDIRRDGMRVGEAIAQYMGQPMQFEEMNDERETTSKDPRVEKETVPAEPSLDKQAKTRRTKQRSKRKPKQIDPDAEYVSDEESSSSYSECNTISSGDDSDGDDDSVWNDSDELIPYNLDDDEQDLRETAVPLYLRECLDMLWTPDTNELAFDRHETAIEAVSSLVRSDPADLPDLAVPLCNALIAFENKTDLPKLQTNIATGLLSLTVMQPVLAGEFLINDFFGGGHGLGMRLLVLRTLEEAAYELCGEKTLREGRKKRNSETTLPMPRIRGKRGLVPDAAPGNEVQVRADRAVASIESRTRRWGGARRQSKPVTVVNMFGPIAPAWFYALISGFMKHKDDTALWGGANGAHVLTNFLIALATIVECSGLVPGTEILARDLCEFAWSFRSIDMPEVRAAVLIAIANSLAVVRDDALMSVLYSLSELPEYLRGVALKDSDETCRRMAATISTNVSQLLGSMIDSRTIES